jgi:hypothetical protein
MSKLAFRISVAVLLTTMVVLFFAIGFMSPEFPALQAKRQAGQTPLANPVAMVAAQAKAAMPLLRSWNCQRAYGHMTLQGEILNRTNAPIKNLLAVARYYTGTKTFVKSDTALIEYNPIMPGQTSPFKVISTDNPMMVECKISFTHLFGGTVEVEGVP